MYTKTYEAHSIISDISLHLDESYAASAMIGMIIAAIAAFALTLFVAIAIKKARPFGVIVAVAQPIGLYAAMQTVLQYAKIDFSCLEITKTSSVSMDDAMNKLNTAIGEAFVQQIFPQMLGMLIWGLVTTIVFVLTLVYVVMILKAKGKGNPKGLIIGSLVILIVKFLLVNPVEMFSLMLQKGSTSVQSTWDIVFRLIYLLPLILLAVEGIVTISAKSKAKNAPAAPVPAEAPAQAPVEETAAPETQNQQ